MILAKVLREQLSGIPGSFRGERPVSQVLIEYLPVQIRLDQEYLTLVHDR